jgi:hypothetical protein
MLRIERYRRTRFWGLYEAGELLCVTVYKKGAQAVKERLERTAVTTPTDPPPQRASTRPRRLSSAR